MAVAKRLVRGIACVLLLTSFTCKSLDNTEIGSTAQSVIPAATVLDQVLGGVPFGGFDNIDFSQSDDFKNQGYSKQEIDSVRIERVSLVITNPADQSFDFLDSIEFYAEAEGLPRTRIAFLSEIPPGVTEIDLDIDDVELVDYAVAPSISVTTEVTGSAPENQTTVLGTIIFNVDINISGVLGC